MTSTENTLTTATLWWSDGGNLRCRDHLPLPGSASWWSDGWTMMPPEQRARLGRVSGKPVACETCGQHAKGAHAEYLAARTAVADAITSLVARLDDLDAREDIDQSNRGYAGTLNHVAAALRDLVPSVKGGAR